MKSGRDSTRRNRNIGTAKRGHGQNNRLVIPTRYYPTLAFYFENLRNYKSLSRDIDGLQITFLVKETRSGSYHACTIDDIAHLLHFVPKPDLMGIELIVLRQPKRKEEVLNSAWGRWVPYVVIDDYRGSAVFLEAVDITHPMRWTKSLMPDAQKELERLQEDGHTVTLTKRHHLIWLSLESVRSTQLYRTLLHEIGHHVDYTRDPDGYEKKNAGEKEVFAHRYADELGEKLRKRRVIPFERKLSLERLKEDRLRACDFDLAAAGSGGAIR